MTSTEKQIFRTKNLDEAIFAVGAVYCPHSVIPKGPARDINASWASRRRAA